MGPPVDDPVGTDDNALSNEALEWIQAEADWELMFQRGRTLMKEQRKAGSKAAAAADMIKEVKRAVDRSIRVDEGVVRTWENRSDRRNYTMR
jgi:hypothetical protein